MRENGITNRWEFLYDDPDSDWLTVGHVTLKVDNKRPGNLSIWNVSVSDGYRKRGIAFSLLQDAIKKFMELDNFHYLWLRTHKKNEIAIELYKKCGFKIIDDPDRAGNNPEKVVMILIKP